MQGIGSAFSSLPAARALIAGAAMLAGALAPAAHGQDSTDDVAFFTPRLSTSGTSLPQPLARADAAHLRRIFTLQAQGFLTAAIAETAELGPTPLLGHVLADRYLGGMAQPTAAELREWLAQYGGLPDAPAIRAALPPLLAPGAVPPAAPSQQPASAPAAPFARNPALDRSVHEPTRAGHFDQALRLIARTRGLGALYGAVLRAEVARAELFAGQDAAALRLAEAANRQAEGRIGLAPYVGGLAAWRLGRMDRARILFEAASRAEIATQVHRSRAAFWAARAYLRLGERGGYALWLQRAAEQPESFYGQLARRILGEPPGPAPLSHDILGEADVAAVGSLPGGERAFALLQIGQDARAAAELRQLWDGARSRPGLSRAVALVARAAGLGELADELALLRPGEDEIAPAEALPSLHPAGGFSVNPALVYALARLESNFNARAVSPAGARGLMQIMPATAGWITGTTATAAIARRLRDPALNLELGQQYLTHLARLDVIRGNLLHLLAAYNSGPASFAHWAGSMCDEGDPLLFIELIPNDETRAYVPRALAYSWFYAARMDLPTSSLDELAAGRWPRFSAEIPSSPRTASLH
jgi:soluble lytic murein transglycosylase